MKKIGLRLFFLSILGFAHLTMLQGCSTTTPTTSDEEGFGGGAGH